MAIEITPEGIHDAVSLVHTYLPKTKIWITENGLSSKNEENQIKFLNLHIQECNKNPLFNDIFIGL